ncbi:helix-turn-helix transcriptional regulator [Paenibacillus xylanilyticus]|uniref:WYL domain-containing protein n=1 Tax=Paenibacillus xylanilyticus TaxID=248903 RepID=A0A7Y6BV77_9BACL|nr:WYL domain-containing protein [Paenibacillus xylanilyticus]NUU75426.1 WYL domain-containing protein [Paenibacillus xylanilyticus]
MSNMHRIHWFDEQIRNGHFPNSSWLAREFEISRRQAQRDIEYMAISLRAPLVYIAKYRGYCYENQTYRLPHLYMTEEEQRVLKYLAHRYRHYDHEQSEVVKRVSHLLERFTLEDQETWKSPLPVFAAPPKQLQHFELLSHAITESRKVHMHYRDHAGERQFSWCPLKMISQYNADYVVGYETDPVQQTAIRLEGIIHVRITNETFECRSDSLLGGWEEPLPVRKPFVAEIRLKEVQQTELWQGYRIRARQDQIHSVEFYDTDAFLQHLFVNEWEELLSPGWLKRKLQQSAERMMDRLAMPSKANVE